MKCLVTGGAGFIGSHLSDRLLAEGHTVVCVDNLLTGSKKNIEHLFSDPQFSFFKQDCASPLPESAKSDVIFHLASPASPPKYQQYPVETMLVNSFGTYQLLELAKNWQAMFIFASTSEVYGDPEKHPQAETYRGNVNPTGQRSCYDESKRLGEALVMTYVRKFGVDGRIVRIFNTYGPRMDIDDGRVVTNFMKQILHTEALTINGNGMQTRSFCYISDLIEGLMKVLVTQAMKGEVVNLGNDEELTVVELAKRLMLLTKYQGEMAFGEMPEDDPMRRRPDLTKVKKLLGWEPIVDLNTGLTKTYEYFKNL